MIAGSMPGAILLDTCALIWLANGDALKADARPRIEAAAQTGGLLVSPISGWEIGLLSRRTGREGADLFAPDPITWFSNALDGPAMRTAPFTHQMAISASSLPGSLHSDPGDRLLIATARHLSIPIVTRDHRIIEYSASGHVEAIPC